MKISRITASAPCKVQLEEGDLDESVLAANDVLIQSQYSLTNSGTEVATFTGLQAEATSDFAYPVVLGRANVGTVRGTGSGITDLAAGDKVLSLGPHSSFFKIDRANILTTLSPEMDPRAACFARMAAVSITAVRKADLAAGDSVLVIGQGIVGNFAAQLFVIAGADVMVADINERRLAVARESGLVQTVNSAKTDWQRISTEKLIRIYSTTLTKVSAKAMRI